MTAAASDREARVTVGVEDVVTRWERSSGVELLRAWADGALPTFAHTERMGERVVAAEPGSLTLSWLPGPHLANLAGTVHGGYISTVLDDATGLCVATLGERFWPSITLDLRVEFLRPAVIGHEHTVVGSVAHHGRVRTVADATIRRADGKLVARASGSFIHNREFDPRALLARGGGPGQAEDGAVA